MEFASNSSKSLRPDKVVEVNRASSPDSEDCRYVQFPPQT